MTEAVSKAFRSGFAAIVGRPSAGKSTLMNSLCGHKVSIISNVPQTTRNRVRGIVNRPAGQIVFVDTPGFHESEKKFNQHMRGLIEEAIRDVELILYVVDASRHIGKEERALAQAIARHSEHIPTLVAINKSDLAKDSDLEATSAWMRETLPEARQVRTCATTGEGTEEIVNALIALAPEGEAVYPADMYPDQPPEFRVSELIREKAINATGQEVPHSIYVDVADMEIRDSDAELPLLWIRAFVLVERESQKGILVGKGGNKIKSIRVGAQKEIAELFPYRIHLDLRVKVDPKWRRKEGLLKRLVY